MNEQRNLIDYAKNVFSEKGEDGILERIFEVIGTTDTQSVEFGAWDGMNWSNTCNLVKNKGWSGIFIEADYERSKEIAKTYAGNAKVIGINKAISFDGPNKIDTTLKSTPISKSFDLISIDIDGNDYHIWDSMTDYQPRVVVIEYNPTIPSDIEFIQPKNMRLTQGSSLLAMYNLGKRKGYELVAVTFLNAIFVKKEYFSKFNIADNTPQTLQAPYVECQFRAFQLYDGTFVLQGRNRMIWHDIRIGKGSVQVIPKMFRMHPDSMGAIRSFAFKVWRKLHNLAAH